MNMVRSPKAAGLFHAAILHSAALGPVLTQEEVVNVTGIIFLPTHFIPIV